MISVRRDDFQASLFLKGNGIYPDERDFRGLVFENDGRLIGAAGIDAGATGIGAFGERLDCTVHVAGRKCWTRRSLKLFFLWVFQGFGFERITAQVCADNAVSLRFAEGLGFKREGIRRKAAPGGRDYIMLGCFPAELKIGGA